MEEELIIPETAPVMVLPGCNFFPHTPLPLRIFEPRYRAMLAMVLEGDRMFCVGSTRQRSVPGLPYDEEAGVYRSGTLGLVRACVRNEDGTSNLILEGLKRVKFVEWERETPFRIARMEVVETSIGEPERVETGIARVLGLVGTLVERGVQKPPQLELRVDSELGPEVVADIVAGSFIRDVEARQVLLGMESLEARLDYLAGQLKGLLATLGPPP